MSRRARAGSSCLACIDTDSEYDLNLSLSLTLSLIAVHRRGPTRDCLCYCSSLHACTWLCHFILSNLKKKKQLKKKTCSCTVQVPKDSLTSLYSSCRLEWPSEKHTWAKYNPAPTQTHTQTRTHTHSHMLKKQKTNYKLCSKIRLCSRFLCSCSREIL